MRVHEFHVIPGLPDRIQRCLELAYNLWWSWNPEAVRLFERMDSEIFRAVHQNPVRLLGEIERERLDQLAADDAFLQHLDGVLAAFDAYRTGESALLRDHPELKGSKIAYFSAEFGIHESLPLYSGGLGVLAGDTLKSASDRGIPLVAVGLAYRFGYFHQQIDRDGRQQELYPENDFSRMPMVLEKDAAGQPLRIEVDLGPHRLRAQIWRVDVGRVPLYLLDSSLPDAPPGQQQISERLYAGDLTMRLEQELLLGIGGVHALRALGHQPAVYHMNEGHSCFLTLEQTARLREEHGLELDEARHLAAASNVFTTHTPVPAGHDEFPRALILPYLQPYAKRLGITAAEVFDLGADAGNGNKEESVAFSMTVLGLRMSRHRNGVSRLHGEVSREMWHHLWPQLPVDETPIGHITNGVHAGTWVAPEMSLLQDRHLGDGWRQRLASAGSLDPQRLPAEDLWNCRRHLRGRLVDEARRRLRAQVERTGGAPAHLRHAERALDPEALTVGFCRRFALYKRATLLLHDIDRLGGIVSQAERPIQFLFAGKAHPQDLPAKKLIKQLIDISSTPPFAGRLVFLEGYDMGLARLLVQGVDIWLNTPRRPFEASGTSGMKVALNGGLNLSILDGWWVEGFHGDNGWAIGEEDGEVDDVTQDAMDAAALYDQLEHEVIPTFYSRGADGLPGTWIEMMRRAMGSSLQLFNTDRMVDEYALRFYRESFASHQLLHEDRPRLQEWTRWWNEVNKHWSKVKIVDLEADLARIRKVGEELNVVVHVDSGDLRAEDLAVEVLHGPSDGEGELLRHECYRAELLGSEGHRHRFGLRLACTRSGRQGIAVRIQPHHGGAERFFDAGLVQWR